MGEASPGHGDIPAPPPANAEQHELPDAATLRAAFDAAEPFTVGVEDEVMLLDPATLELAPVAAHVLQGADPRDALKLELPAAQLEIVTPPFTQADDLAPVLLELRRRACDRVAGRALLAAAGAHPFSSGTGPLNELPRYAHTFDRYGAVAARQLVCALQVHVAVGDAPAALAVYNSAREYLPLIAALAANAPLYEGQDTGLASVRPEICTLLPRQGVPPALRSWEELAEAYRWGAATGAFPVAGSWWWELRPHPRYGTLEFRVPDGQSTVADAIAVAALIQALVAWLAERHGAGEPVPPAASWRIAENRWSALRFGVEGSQADLRSGLVRPTGELLAELLETLRPYAERLGGARALARASELAHRSGAQAQREVFRRDGARGVAAWLAERFLDPVIG